MKVNTWVYDQGRLTKWQREVARFDARSEAWKMTLRGWRAYWRAFKRGDEPFHTEYLY